MIVSIITARDVGISSKLLFAVPLECVVMLIIHAQDPRHITCFLKSFLYSLLYISSVPFGPAWHASDA